MPAAATGGRGSAFFTGFARRQASRSVAPRWTKTPSAGSKSTTPTSSSTGRKFSKRSRLLHCRPTNRACAGHAAIAIARDRLEPRRRLLRHPKPKGPHLHQRNWNPWTSNLLGTGTPGTRNPRNSEPLEPEPLELEPEVVQAFEQLTHPEAEEKIAPPVMPVEQNLGREQLTRLRARYAELLARITERGGDAERVEALRAQAESLNPDTWVTDEEVRQGLESFEPKIRDLRAALGLRRRRRSRRGGRRGRGGERTESERGEG